MKYLILLSALLIVGCNSSTDQPAATSEKAQANAVKKPKIALIMKSLANDFFATMETGAKLHHDQHAEQYDLLTNGIKDESDLGRQVALVEEMVAAGANAIVIAPADSKALVPALRRAMQSGVVVVNIDNQLDAEILQTEGITIPFVGPDNQVGAKKVGDFLAAKLKKGDQVTVLEGKPTAINGVQRRLGFEAAMNEAGMTIVSSQTADWETNKANTIAASMLSEHPEIKAILAANDSMALGAVAAIKSAGRTGEVMVVGFDNIPAVQELIREDKILATADQHAGELAVFGIETALEILNHPDSTPANVETPVDLITATNLTD